MCPRVPIQTRLCKVYEYADGQFWGSHQPNRCQNQEGCFCLPHKSLKKEAFRPKTATGIMQVIGQKEAPPFHIHSSPFSPATSDHLSLAILVVTSITLNNILMWLSNPKDLGLVHGNLYRFSRTWYFSHMWSPLFPIPSATGLLSWLKQ